MFIRRPVLLMVTVLLSLASGGLISTSEAQVLEPVDVKLFEAIGRGQVASKIVANGYSVMSLALQNRTPRVLRVTAPEAFAAVPQKQVSRRKSGGSTLYSYRGSGDDGYPQGLGGSFYNREQPTLPNENQGEYKVATWLLQPGQTVTFQVPCFCMEFGKPDPNPRVPYVLLPLRAVTKSPAISELLVRFGKGKCPQSVAQLAMWNVANGTSWQLLSKVRWPNNKAQVSGTELRAAGQLVQSLSQSLADPASDGQ